MLHVGFRDSDFDAVGVNDGGKRGKAGGRNLLEPTRKILAFVVGEHGFFFGVEHDEVRSEAEGGVFAENLYIFATESGFESVGDALRVGAEHHRVALEVEAQLVVVLADFGKFLADGGLEHFVNGALLARLEHRMFAERPAADVHSQRGVLDERFVVQQDVVADAVSQPDPDFDALVGRAQGEVGISGAQREPAADGHHRETQCGADKRESSVHRILPFQTCHGSVVRAPPLAAVQNRPVLYSRVGDDSFFFRMVTNWRSSRRSFSRAASSERLSSSQVFISWSAFAASPERRYARLNW